MPSVKHILRAALLVGTLDISAAFIQVYLQSGHSPFKPVLYFVASGLLGKTSPLSVGATMAAGLLIHYLIATTFTVIFFLLVAHRPFAREHRLLTGIAFGIFVWVVMNLLVLPLTNTRPFVFNLSKNALSMGILIVCIGIPLALLTNRRTATTPAMATATTS